MCGIAGFSLSRGSKLQPRKLSNALLCGIESRGNQASGFAFQSPTRSGVFKNNVAGSRLSLRGLPRNANSVILHTRYATHGSVKVMANNHPVMSPDNKIALVHNGVIYNHDRVRLELPFKLAEVDTSVIPALLQKFDFNSFDMLDGDASVAWLDESDVGVLRVARISHSPLFIAQVEDGSFVFASTETILLDALKRVGARVVFLKQVDERVLYEVRDGRIVSEFALPEVREGFVEKVSYSSYGSYRNMTSGGKQNNHFYNDTPSSFAGYGDGYDLDSDDDFYPADYISDAGFGSWLASFTCVDGFYYDVSGAFLGDLGTMREDYEDFRYNEYWATQNSSYEFYSPASMSEGTLKYQNLRAFKAGEEVDLF